MKELTFHRKDNSCSKRGFSLRTWHPEGVNEQRSVCVRTVLLTPRGGTPGLLLLLLWLVSDRSLTVGACLCLYVVLTTSFNWNHRYSRFHCEQIYLFSLEGLTATAGHFSINTFCLFFFLELWFRWNFSENAVKQQNVSSTWSSDLAVCVAFGIISLCPVVNEVKAPSLLLYFSL